MTGEKKMSLTAFSHVDIEKVRSYWNAQPCNIRHSEKEVGSKEYFDEVEARKYRVEPHIPLFAQFERWKGKQVLEIGCGIGTDTINFARAGAEVTVIDLSDASLEVAKKRAEVFGVDVSFNHGNAEKITSILPDKKYDLVYSFGVIHHTPNPEKVIEEIKKVMNPESELKIMMYNRFSWKSFWVLMKYGKGRLWEIDKWVAKYSEAQTGCPVTYSYSKKSIRKLLNGFIIKDIQIDHIFPYSIPEYRKYQYKKVWYFRYLPKGLFRFLERNFGWHLCVTAKLDHQDV